MNWKQFEVDVSSGQLYATLLSGQPVLGVVGPFCYAPSAREHRLFVQAARILIQHLDLLTPWFFKADLNPAPDLLAVLLHSPETKDIALMKLTALMEESNEFAHINVCRCLAKGPPEVTEKLIPLVSRVFKTGSPRLRSFALRALAFMNHQESLTLAEAELRNPDPEMQRSVGIYFYNNQSSKSIQALAKAVRTLPSTSPGWSTAVLAISGAGLLAAEVAPVLSDVAQKPETDPSTKARLALCLLEITLSQDSEEEALALMREILTAGIEAANAGEIMPADDAEESDEADSDPRIAGAVRILSGLAEISGTFRSLENLIVAALLAKDWQIRYHAARVAKVYEVRHDGLFEALKSALQGCIAAGDENQSRHVPVACAPIMQAMMMSGALDSEIVAALESFLLRLDQKANEAATVLARKILDQLKQ